MGKLIDRMRKLQDYPGNKPLAGVVNSTPASPSKDNPSEKRDRVTNKIGSITSEEIIAGMDFGDLDDTMEFNLKDVEKTEAGRTDFIINNTTVMDSESVMLGLESEDAVESEGLNLLSAFDQTIKNPSMSILDYSDSRQALEPPVLDKAIGEALFGGASSEVSAPPVQPMRAFDLPDYPARDTEDVARTLAFTPAEEKKALTWEEIEEFYSRDAISLDMWSYTTKVERNNEGVVYTIIDTDIASLEVDIVDTEGRISDAIERVANEIGQVMVPLKLTEIPEAVKPIRHQVVNICNELYFMPITTNITERTNAFLDECIADIESGRRIDKDVMVSFNYKGESYTTSRFTLRELTLIVSSLRRYKCNLHDDGARLRIVGGDY